MNRQQAINYLRSSGFSEEQIAGVESAFTCEDAISRQAAIDAMATWDWQELYFPIHFKQLLEELPSVSTKKIGQWKRISIDKYVQHAMAYYRCSECGKDNIGESNFCPNCGARMGVEE